MIIVMVMMTGVKVSYGQNWDSSIFGTWNQTSTYKSNVYTKNISSVNLISINKANVTVDNSTTQFNLKTMPNGSWETLMPLEIKSMYGYDAKKVFIRFYNQNNQLRVVRKIYEYDRSGKILNQAQVDSVLFRRGIDKAILNAIANNPVANSNTKVANANPLSDKIKPYIQFAEDGSKKLSSYTSFKVNIINMEVINKGDDDDNGNEKFLGKFYYRDAFEVTGNIYYISENGTFSNIFKTRVSPTYSIIIPVGTPHPIQQTFSYSLLNKPFSSGALKFKIDLHENDMKDYGGDSPGKGQLSVDKDLNILLSTLNYGDNQILLYSRDGGSLVLNINITGKVN